jgi:hypothetical protein
MRIRLFAHTFVLLFLLAAYPSYAMSSPPPRITPIVDEGVRYVVPNDKGQPAYVEAWDAQSGQKLWTKTIFRHWYVPIPFGPNECMSYEYLTSMTLKNSVLILTSARGREYTLDIRTRTLRQIKAKRPNNQPAAPNPSRAS